MHAPVTECPVCKSSGDIVEDIDGIYCERCQWNCGMEHVEISEPDN